ncbi:MAG: ABC transporter ATP-binding protein [Solirubrobacteraceae bacterium]|nr:ABC transporter ATP-binding protein [Solirubrobacteraceae bacterium]
MARHEDDPRLHAAGVTVQFGGLTALDDVSLDVGRGEVVGVIGPNGAGKTTLFNVLCGFVRPQAGTVTWRGQSLDGVRPHQLAGLGIARTLQGVGLFAGLTAAENVMAAAPRAGRPGVLSGLLGLPRADRDERRVRAGALEVLERLDVRDAADRLPGTLPYGVQKRVGLARALAARPDLLLLDEPAGGLSGGDITDLAGLIKGLRREMGVLLVEHHMDLVMEVCDRIVVLDFGKRIASGTPEEIQADPAVLDAYLGTAAADA